MERSQPVLFAIWSGIISGAGLDNQARLVDSDLEIVILARRTPGFGLERQRVIDSCVPQTAADRFIHVVTLVQDFAAGLHGKHLESQVSKTEILGGRSALQELLVVR